MKKLITLPILPYYTPCPLTRHTDTLGWQPSWVTLDTPAQTACHIFSYFL